MTKMFKTFYQLLQPDIAIVTLFANRCARQKV